MRNLLSFSVVSGLLDFVINTLRRVMDMVDKTFIIITFS